MSAKPDLRIVLCSPRGFCAGVVRAIDTVERALATLPERERNVIELRFGTGDEAPQSLAEAGKRLGISRQRTQQLESQALQRLAGRPELAALREAA